MLARWHETYLLVKPKESNSPPKITRQSPKPPGKPKEVENLVRLSIPIPRVVAAKIKKKAAEGHTTLEKAALFFVKRGLINRKP